MERKNDLKLLATKTIMVMTIQWLQFKHLFLISFVQAEFRCKQESIICGFSSMYHHQGRLTLKSSNHNLERLLIMTMNKQTFGSTVNLMTVIKRVNRRPLHPSK